MSSDQKLKLTVGGLIMAMLLVALIFLLLKDVPKDNQQMFNILLGGILVQFANLASFCFPSNIESAQKNSTIANMASTAAAQTTPAVETTVKTTTAGDVVSTNGGTDATLG